jgi:hypothetical protein
VTPEGDVCWEWVSPFVLPFKGVLCSMLFRAHRYSEDGPELGGKKPDSQRYTQLNQEWGLASKS